ncbi:gamma carbonic anhydrase family protein [Candidatus Avelusimicrobium luingense]|uniref:gamma carbonic anhydrase family protein n=1 Tax=Candidatus Avelusimicrobium luingense TaxID=3416211 RepID=UPI003D0DAE24
MKERINEQIPHMPTSCFVHKSAVIIGEVTLGENVSVWPCAVLRGDIASITVGDNSNIQENACVHVNYDAPAVIGKGVSVGHGAVVHGSKIGDNCLIGMNAVVMESEIGPNCIIGAGAVVPAGKNIPAGSLVMGVPAKIVRQLDEDEVNAIMKNARDYTQSIELYRKNCKEI